MYQSGLFFNVTVFLVGHDYKQFWTCKAAYAPFGLTHNQGVRSRVQLCSLKAMKTRKTWMKDFCTRHGISLHLLWHSARVGLKMNILCPSSCMHACTNWVNVASLRTGNSYNLPWPSLKWPGLEFLPKVWTSYRIRYAKFLFRCAFLFFPLFLKPGGASKPSIGRGL